MAAPANDLFANARYIYDGIQFGDDLTGATIETGEAWSGLTTGLRSIWYKWVAAASTSVTVSLPVRTNHSLNVFYSPGTDVDDTISTIVPLSTSNAVSQTFTATQGVTYYFRVANSSGVNLFQMAFPVGMPPGAYRGQGTNDLPTNLGATLRSSSGVHLMEAVGYGPSSERTTSHIHLLLDDEHSDSPFASDSLLVRNSDNSPSPSAERWVRVRFDPPFAAITNLRFWVNNWDPNSGWALYYGLSTFFRKPSTSISNIATRPVPSIDPGDANLGVDLLSGGQVQYSSWLVLQAVWIGGAPGTLQTSELNFEFDWTEM